MIELLREPAVWLLITAMLVPLGTWWGVRQLAVARTIADTPTSRVRSAAQGYVAVSGFAQAMPDEPAVAPLTQLPSVWWYYCIEKRNDPNDKRGWTTVTQGTSEQPFLLNDATGQCVVDPADAKVYPAIRKVWYGSMDWPAPALGSTGMFGALFHRYRYTEHRIPVRCDVHVMGEFRTLGSAASDAVQADVVDLLRKWKSDQQELLRRFDTNRDGVISAQEWDHARQLARQYVLAEQAKAPPQPAVNMLAKPTDTRPFLIAAVDVQHIAATARRQALAAWLAAIISSGACTWLLLHRAIL